MAHKSRESPAKKQRFIGGLAIFELRFLLQRNTVKEIAATRFASSNLAAWEREIFLEVELQSKLNFARISNGGGDNAEALVKE